MFKAWVKELDAKINPVTFKTESVGNNVLLTRLKDITGSKGKQIIPDYNILSIKDVVDIKVLSQADESLLKKALGHGNKLLEHSGKDSFSEIETDDIKRYFDNRIKCSCIYRLLISRFNTRLSNVSASGPLISIGNSPV